MLLANAAKWFPETTGELLITEACGWCYGYSRLANRAEKRDRRSAQLRRILLFFGPPGDTWLRLAVWLIVPIDPVELQLSARTYETAQMHGVFGALRDAGPDYWGRRVIEKHAGKAQLGELDYLLESPDDRAGALGFGLNTVPPAPLRKFNKTLDLEKLQSLADALLRDEIPNDPEAPQVQDLMLLGTSMGGARPKAVVQDKDGLWIAKFNRWDDGWNNTRVEPAMLRLARECGITAAESRIETVGGKDVLLIKRFDREKTAKGYARAWSAA